MYPVVAIVGPTGSGKSDLGLEIAKHFQGEIINCDSVQVYCGLDIGSAKVPICDRQRVIHHLLDVISPEAELSAGAYAGLARAALQNVASRRNLPVVVGGTGLYLRALFEGLSPAPTRDKALRERLQTRDICRPLLLHRFLRRFDPIAATRIHPHDRQKLTRAVELTIRSGKPASAIQSESRDALTGVRILKIGLEPDRNLLYEKLNQRTTAMFEHGLLEETRKLLDSGLSPKAKSLQTLGYKQAVLVLESGLSPSEAVSQCQTRTRQYAKRQLTWFRHEADVHWLQGFGGDLTIQRLACELCRNFLGTF